MRTTISIPDEFYSRLKKKLPSEGYTTVNEYILSLLRHRFDDLFPTASRSVDKNPALCKHGSPKGLCKYGCK